MDKIKQFFKNPLYFGAAGLIVGTVIGLVVLGWGLWPVRWTDAAPVDLNQDYQRDYLCMTINSFIQNQDEEMLNMRWEGLGEGANDLLNSLTPAVCRFDSSDKIDAFKEVMSISAEMVVEDSQPEQKDKVSDELPVIEEPAVEVKTVSLLPLAILILLTLVVGGILIFLMIKRSKGEAAVKIKIPKIVIPNKKVKKAEPSADPVKQTSAKEPPLAQFMTTYRQGDDLYDDSFSIDSVNGEFLGECGVGIAETIGVGEPKKVTALEVWLFDKNDIQTVTKVMMSEHASNDPALSQRLQSKGEPVMVVPGMRFLMETATLQMEAHVVDMVYARGPLPENSYFSRLTLEVSVWPK